MVENMENMSIFALTNVIRWVAFELLIKVNIDEQ